MSKVIADLRYAKSHEWVRVEDNIAVVGISDYAQDLLGDVVFVELPEVGTQVTVEDSISVVESVKAASDIYAPVSGEIIEVNEMLEDAPESINEDPYGNAWIFKIQMSQEDELNNLLTADEYQATCND